MSIADHDLGETGADLDCETGINVCEGLKLCRFPGRGCDNVATFLFEVTDMEAMAAVVLPWRKRQVSEAEQCRRESTASGWGEASSRTPHRVSVVPDWAGSVLPGPGSKVSASPSKENQSGTGPGEQQRDLARFGDSLSALNSVFEPRTADDAPVFASGNGVAIRIGDLDQSNRGGVRIIRCSRRVPRRGSDLESQPEKQVKRITSDGIKARRVKAIFEITKGYEWP